MNIDNTMLSLLKESEYKYFVLSSSYNNGDLEQNIYKYNILRDIFKYHNILESETISSEYLNNNILIIKSGNYSREYDVNGFSLEYYEIKIYGITSEESFELLHMTWV